MVVQFPVGVKDFSLLLTSQRGWGLSSLFSGAEGHLPRSEANAT
jgi:hypothetical protein